MFTHKKCSRNSESEQSKHFAKRPNLGYLLHIFHNMYIFFIFIKFIYTFISNYKAHMSKIEAETGVLIIESNTGISKIKPYTKNCQHLPTPNKINHKYLLFLFGFPVYLTIYIVKPLSSVFFYIFVKILYLAEQFELSHSLFLKPQCHCSSQP